MCSRQSRTKEILTLLHTNKAVLWKSRVQLCYWNLILSWETKEVVLFYSKVFVPFSLIAEMHLTCGGIWKNAKRGKNATYFKQLLIWSTSNKETSFFYFCYEHHAHTPWLRFLFSYNLIYWRLQDVCKMSALRLRGTSPTLCSPLTQHTSLKPLRSLWVTQFVLNYLLKALQDRAQTHHVNSSDHKILRQ